MLVLAGLLRFVSGRKIWREFCHRLASILFPALGTRLALKRFENDSGWLILLPVFSSCNWSETSPRVLITVKPRYNEPLYNEVHGITKRYASPLQLQQIMGKNLDITKPRYIEHILPVPWPFDISRLHCTRVLVAQH